MLKTPRGAEKKSAFFHRGMNDIQIITYVATSTDQTGSTTTMVGTYTAPVILFCFVAIVFIFTLLVINPIIQTLYKK